jgi:hypothetical protein
MKSKDPNANIKIACETMRQKLEATKRRLVETAAEFKQLVEGRAPAKSAAAAKLAEMLSGADWSRVRPAGLPELAPWTERGGWVAFVPSQWPEIDCGRLSNILRVCHQAFIDLDRAYRKARTELSEAELQELFPDGPPKP